MPAKRKSNFHGEADWMPASAVRPDPNNANEHSERSIVAIAKSLLRFGFRKPIVADKHKVVRAGNGTLEAVLWIAAQNADSPEDEQLRTRAQEVGILRPNAKGKLIPYVRCEITHLEGDEATAYALADNQTGRLSQFNFARVAEQLRDLQSKDARIDDLGFDLTKVLGDLNNDNDGAADNSSNVNVLGQMQYKIIILCENEKHQAELLTKLENEGLQCQLLTL